MATSPISYNYQISNTDGSLSFVVPPLQTNGPTSPTNATLPSGASGQHTSLTFIGKGYPGYGVTQQRNLLYMLENFAGSVAPVNPVIGQLWYDKGTDTLKLRTATQWDTIAGSGTFIPRAGDTVPGTLTFTGGSSKIEIAYTPTVSTDPISKTYAESTYVSRVGDTLTSDLTFGTGANVIVGTTPTAPYHLPNKQYVDDQIALASASTTAVPTTNSSLNTMLFGTPVIAISFGVTDPINSNEATSRVIGVTINSLPVLPGSAVSVQSAGIVTGTTLQWDAVCTSSYGGLVAGATYYVTDVGSSTKLTRTPTTNPTSFLITVGRAISSTQMVLTLDTPFQV